MAVGGILSGQPAKGRTLVRIDPRYLRPTEVDTLLGDASKARARLGWRPRVGFEALVAGMIEADLREAERGMRHDAMAGTFPTSCSRLDSDDRHPGRGLRLVSGYVRNGCGAAP